MIQFPLTFRLMNHQCFIDSFVEVVDFAKCYNLKEAKLPAQQNIISKRMLYGCTNLRRMNLPSTVEVLKECSFESSGITQVTLTRIELGSFSLCRMLTFQFPIPFKKSMLRFSHIEHL